MTQDLTKITTPFGLLDVETKAALQEAERNGKVVQLYTRKGWIEYKNMKLLGWYDSTTFRIKPEQKVVNRWVNVYDLNAAVIPHSSRELADKNAYDNRICVLRIEWHDGVPSFHKEEN